MSKKVPVLLSSREVALAGERRWMCGVQEVSALSITAVTPGQAVW